MNTSQDNIFLYEALELRNEYQARLASLKALLPEHRQVRRGFLERDDGERREPAAGFDPAKIRENIRSLEYKSRKLNAAIQQVNFSNKIRVQEEEISLAEALEMRKAVNQELAGLQKMLERSAYRKIIYKEERNITEEPEEDFSLVSKQIEEQRLLFRQLNRALRKAAFEIKVPFRDEA